MKITKQQLRQIIRESNRRQAGTYMRQERLDSLQDALERAYWDVISNAMNDCDDEADCRDIAYESIWEVVNEFFAARRRERAWTPSRGY